MLHSSDHGVHPHSAYLVFHTILSDTFSQAALTSLMNAAVIADPKAHLFPR